MTAAGRVGSSTRARVEARVREILGGTDGAVPDPAASAGHHRAPPAASRRNAVALGVVALVVGVVALGWVLAARPKATPVVPAASRALGQTTASSAPASPSAAAEGVVVVDVAGRVRRPGVYRLRVGARVDDALRAAGGALPGVSLEALNLAARLVDGQQVPVGIAAAAAPGGAGATPGGGSGGSGGAASPVDLNTASLDQLDGLPGVGPVLAQQIVDWRTGHGRFQSIDQLTEVPGIGTAKLATLRPLVSV